MRTLHAAVITVLEEGLSRPVGDTRSPDGDPFDLAPYVVVYPLWRHGSDGPTDDKQADGIYAEQFTCVGRDPEGALWMRDTIRTILTRAALQAEWTDGTVMFIDWDDGSGAVNRDDDLQPPLFYCTDRIDIGVTP